MKRVFAVLLIVAMLLSLGATAVSAAPKKPLTPPELHKVVFIHYENQGKGKGPPPGKGKPEEEEPDKVYTDYKLLGTSWDLNNDKTTEDPKYAELVNKEYPSGVPYYFNPGGPWGIPKGIAFNDALDAITPAYEAWDKATTVELFVYGSLTTATPSFDEPDGKNVVCWWGIAPPSAIAMAIIWYYDANGNDKMDEPDELVDCDVVFNALQKWSIEPNKRTFHVQNIATHEAGHVTGLGDLYDEVDSEMTMYGYSKKGETKKCTLEEGDWEGCRALYGGVEFPYESPRD